MKEIISKAVFIIALLVSLLGVINSATALLLGLIFAIIFKNPFEHSSRKAIPFLLKIAVVGLGFGMHFRETLETGKEGFGLTVLSIIFTISLGIILSKILKLDRKLGHLIISGTSICGGSAIAAISAVIKAESQTISIALGIIFLLNSVALFLFPTIGHSLDLTQGQFGLWCAVAIHDTSSVVGSTIDYGDEALRVATTIKLSRTLWIIPLSILSAIMFKTKGESVKIPFFILLFLMAILINSYNVLPASMSDIIVVVSKRILVMTLFIVGTTLSINNLKSIGLKPIVFAVLLWLFISVFSLVFILYS